MSAVHQNPKNVLLERLQKLPSGVGADERVPNFRTVQTGESHCPSFTCELRLPDTAWAAVTGGRRGPNRVFANDQQCRGNKKEAEKSAAKTLLDFIDGDGTTAAPATVALGTRDNGSRSGESVPSAAGSVCDDHYSFGGLDAIGAGSGSSSSGASPAPAVTSPLGGTASATLTTSTASSLGAAARATTTAYTPATAPQDPSLCPSSSSSGPPRTTLSSALLESIPEHRPTFGAGPVRVPNGAAGDRTPSQRGPLQLRPYQQSCLDMLATKHVVANIITGGGKTLIAARGIDQRLEQLDGEDIDLYANRDVVVMLVPTSGLIHQQAKEIRRDSLRMRGHGSNVVAVESGGQWSDKGEWGAVLQRPGPKVFVGVPDIILKALNNKSLPVERLCIMIADEAHYCTGTSSMLKCVLTAKNFNVSNRGWHQIRLLGLTASFFQGRVTTRAALDDCRKNLLDLFDGAEVFSPKMGEVEEFLGDRYFEKVIHSGDGDKHRAYMEEFREPLAYFVREEVLRPYEYNGTSVFERSRGSCHGEVWVVLVVVILRRTSSMCMS